MRFIMRIKDGEMTPRLYAVCYREWSTNRLVCAPVGFHLVVLLAWWIGYRYDRWRHHESWIDREIEARAHDLIENWNEFKPRL